MLCLMFYKYGLKAQKAHSPGQRPVLCASAPLGRTGDDFFLIYFQLSITCSADSIPALSAQTPGCRVSRAFVRVLVG